jgi:2-polyprenyl-3-methyl-5-hydroxy-6-metoxy-1,4-benzoquinol methylase
VSAADSHDWIADALQDREHQQEIARRHRDKVTSPVSLAVLADRRRRPWDGAWAAYDALRRHETSGRRILVPCCGFGEDAIRLAKMGFDVHAIDALPELLDIARQRARHFGIDNIRFGLMSGLPIAYPDGYFDRVFFDDVLHHIDIPDMLAETRRVLRPDGVVVVNEHYAHSAVQRLRDSRLVANYLHDRMIGFIYGSRDLYVSEDGHKIDEKELAAIDGFFAAGRSMTFFSLFCGRLLPAGWRSVARLDRALLNLAGPVGRLLAGRVVIAGRLRPAA